MNLLNRLWHKLQGKRICRSCGEHHPDGVHVMTQEELADDVVGPGHPLYPMLMDAMRSKEPVFYEGDGKGKMTKTDGKPKAKKKK